MRNVPSAAEQSNVNDRLAEGRVHFAAGRFREAREWYAAALRLEPANAEALDRLGAVHEELNDLPQALHFYRESVRVNPLSPEAHCSLGHLYSKARQFERAIKSFENALRLDPVSVAGAKGLGLTMHRQGKVAAAAHYYREALRVDPGDAGASNQLSTALRDLGQIDAAIAQCRATLRLDPHHAYAIFNLCQYAAAGHLYLDAIDLERIESRIAAGNDTDFDRSLLCFGIAAVYDSRGDSDDAFAFYRRGNELRKKSHPFDLSAHQRLVEKFVGLFDAAYFRNSRGVGQPSRVPIFIVGMPRTGSTLVEQILATDPDVYAAGELLAMPQLIDRLIRPLNGSELAATLPADRDVANLILDHLAKISRGAPRITIKTLENFLHLGVIATLFPEARIVHCVRDPLDVCVSCYFQNFSNVNFSWDFDDIAAYYRSYQRLIAHWQKTLPLPLHEVHYEDLVRNPEAVTRALFAHCGLEWNARCLRYFENKNAVQTASTLQVRKPLTTKSVGRWQRYRAHLGPLFAALGMSASGLVEDPFTPQPSETGSVNRIG